MVLASNSQCCLSMSDSIHPYTQRRQHQEHPPGPPPTLPPGIGSFFFFLFSFFFFLFSFFRERATRCPRRQLFFFFKCKMALLKSGHPYKCRYHGRVRRRPRGG